MAMDTRAKITETKSKSSSGKSGANWTPNIPIQKTPQGSIRYGSTLEKTSYKRITVY